MSFLPCLYGLRLTSAPNPTAVDPRKRGRAEEAKEETRRPPSEQYDPDAHAEAIHTEAMEMYSRMSPAERWEWMQSVGNVSVSPMRQVELEEIKELFDEWGVHGPADEE